MIKKITAFLLVFTMLFSSLAISSYAAEDSETDYPYIFVHGMGGWARFTSRGRISCFGCKSKQVNLKGSIINESDMILLSSYLR